MRSWGGSCLLVVAVGCAQSLEGLEGDVDGGATEDAPLVIQPDARVVPDATIRYDAAFQNQFNEPCRDRGECASGICILAPTGGYCSRFCNAGGCPQGFGCYGVLGLIEPGQVSYVCVKDTNLLCSPCVGSG